MLYLSNCLYLFFAAAAGGDDEEDDGEDRLHRLSARRSDPTRAGSARRTVPSVKVKDQVNQGQGMMDAVGEVSHRVRFFSLTRAPCLMQ